MKTPTAILRALRPACIALIMTILLPSCTHNGGDIGNWFGHWRLQSISVNGQPDENYTGNIFWAFQSNVTEMIETSSGPDGKPLEMQRCWGTWEEKDKTLVLYYNHKDNDNPANAPKYTPLAITRLPYGVSELRIDQFTATTLVLTYTATDGSLITYRLQKQG